MDKKNNVFLSILHGINIVRLVITNIIFFTFLFFVFIFCVYFSTSSESLPSVSYGTILEIAPEGVIIEEANDYEWVSEFIADASASSRLFDILKAIRSAANDERIEAIYLNFSSLENLSLSHLNELEVALKYFKKSGKPIWAYSDSYSQQDYYIASFADCIGLDPLGEVDLKGFSVENMYFKGMEEKFGLLFQTFHAGECKGAVEPFSRKNMSDDVRENIGSMLFDMWSTYCKNVSKNIKKYPEEIESFALRPYELMLKYNGSEGAMALGEGMVSELVEEGAFRERMQTELSSNSDEELSFLSFDEYVKSIEPIEKDDKVAIIYLTGAIASASSSGRSSDVASPFELEELFEMAEEDDSIKAVVLRIDSGGGEVFASERIRRSLKNTIDKIEKPVVVSMGDVAASGAYWISSSASYIFATPFTITGSIGVLAVLPNFHNLLQDKLGITTDSVGVLGDKSSLEPLSDDEIKKMKLSVNATYDLFIDTVSKGRNMSASDVLPIAGGRIYSGLQALELGLVDEIGVFQDAIDKAAELSELDDFGVVELKLSSSSFNQLMNDIFAQNDSYNAIFKDKAIKELMFLQASRAPYIYSPYRLNLAK